MYGAGTTARRFAFVLYVIYHTPLFQAPSSNRLMHSKLCDHFFTLQQNGYELEFSKGAGMAPKQLKETISEPH